MSMQTWISILTNLFPVISALTCCLLMILTYKDSVREEERYLKRGLFFFYCFWLGLRDRVHVVTSPFCLFE